MHMYHINIQSGFCFVLQYSAKHDVLEANSLSFYTFSCNISANRAARQVHMLVILETSFANSLDAYATVMDIIRNSVIKIKTTSRDISLSIFGGKATS